MIAQSVYVLRFEAADEEAAQQILESTEVEEWEETDFKIESTSLTELSDS